MKKLLLLFLVAYSTPLVAQSNVEFTVAELQDSTTKRKHQVRDSIRSKFVKRFPDHFFVWPVIKRRSLEVEARSNANKDHKVLFKPNNSVAFGVGFYLFEIAFEVAFAVPVEEQSKFKYGTSTASDFQLNALGKFWGFDVYHQKYSGFYLDDSETDVPQNQPFIQRADIDTRNFGLAGIYTFNRDKFSLRSSYNFAEQQIYSRGSWFVTGTINSFKIKGDSALLSIPNREAFSEFSDFVDLRYTTFGIAPGYSHNFIYKKFFVNLTLGIGPAHNWTYFKLANGTERNSVSINSISVARIGLGYNADRFFAGIGFVNQSRNLKIEDFRISNSSGIFKLIVGYRFKEFGILKKRAVDFIPFKI
jgi:Domain of unknown function (DUF4421)